MDVSDVSVKAPVNSAVVKTTGTAVKRVPASVGNILPDTGKVHAHVDKPQANTFPKQPDAAKLQGLVDQANKALAKRSSTLKFSMADGTDIRIIRIVDTETCKLIRQIPSEQMVAIATAFKDIKQGAMLEDKA